MHPIVLASITSIVASGVVGSGFLPLTPFLVPPLWVGWVLSAQGIAACVSQVLSGYLVDTYGSQRILRHGLEATMVSVVLAVAATFWPEQPWLQLLARLPLGAAGAAIFNACVCLISDNFQEPERAKHIGSVLGWSVVSCLLGTPVAASVFSYAADFCLPSRTILALAPLCLLLVTAYILLVRAPLSSKGQELPAGKLEPLLGDEQEPAADGRSAGVIRQLCALYLGVGRQGFCLVVLLVWVFGAFMAMEVAVLLDLKNRHFSSLKMGAVFMPGMVVSAVVAPLAGELASTPKRRRALMVSSCFLMAATLFSVNQGFEDFAANLRVLQLAVLMMILECALSLVDAPSISLMTALAEKQGVGNGQAVTASELAVTVGSALGPYFGGLVYHTMGFDWLCNGICVGCVFLGFFCAALLESSDDGDIASSKEGDSNAVPELSSD